jgi:hypothetical protein
MKRCGWGVDLVMMRCGTWDDVTRGWGFGGAGRVWGASGDGCMLSWGGVCGRARAF